MDYKYIIKPCLPEYTFWNEVLASSELTAETARGDFYSMPPKHFIQGPVTEQI